MASDDTEGDLDASQQLEVHTVHIIIDSRGALLVHIYCASPFD